MDENYLDSLLEQVSNKGKGKKNNFDQSVDLDSGIDIDLSDLDNISLDELDGVDELDLSSLDLDDIDFDDLDVTRLDTGAIQVSAKEEEDYDLNELLEELSEEDFDEQEDSLDSDASSVDAATQTRQPEDMGDEEVSLEDIDAFIDSINLETEDAFMSENGANDTSDVNDVPDESDLHDVPDDSDSHGASGDDEVFQEAQMQMETDTDYPEELVEEEEDLSEESSSEADSEDDVDVDSMDLDDLFSALGIEDEEETSEEENYTAGEESLGELLQSSMELGMERGELSDIEDINDVKPADGKKGKKKKKKEKGEKQKKTISEILFGEPDEDDAEEERLFEEKRAEKEIKKAQKKEAKEAKDASKKQALEVKKKGAEQKRKEKEAKKAEKEAELRAELEAEKDAKKVPTAVVIIVFALFAGLTVLVVLGSKQFDYSQLIRKAADYFERQRYHLAYDEIVGVEVREKDEELRDRIYTVMYVERLYESYENNMTLGRPDKALDALLRGLEKYDEHYAEAIELNIVDDINVCKEKIINALWNTYGLTEENAYEIIALEGQAYSQTLLMYSASLQTGE